MLTPDAGAERPRRLARHQRLAAQETVLIREGDAHDLQPLLLNKAQHARRRLLLLGRPEGVTLDETH
jgi:hypothetical protein